MIDRQSVIDRLHEIVDPCSAASGSNIDIVELGLVRSVEIRSATVEISLRLTTPMCHQVPYFIERAESIVGELPEVESVTVKTDHGFDWTPDMMSDQARESREVVFEEHRDHYSKTPADKEQSEEGMGR